MKARLVNLALYQGGWFACVLGAAYGHPWLGAGAAALLVLAHLALARDRRAEAVLVLWVGVVGTGVDSALMHAGVFRFEAGQWVWWLCPAWMTVLWLQFATLLRHAVGWLRGRYLLGALLGAAGAPLAYGSGVRLGAAAFGLPTAESLAALAAVWAVVTPALLWLEARLRPAHGVGGYRL